MIPTFQIGQTGRAQPLNNSDPLFSQVVLLLQGGSTTDQSSFARTVTANNCTANYSTWTKNGANSILISSTSFGTQGYLTWDRTPSELLFGTGEWCFEGYFNYTSSLGTGFHYYNDGVGGSADALSLRVNSSSSSGLTEFRKNGGSSAGVGPSFTTPGECYFCAERVGDTLYCSIDGVVASSAALGASFAFATPTHDTRIGAANAVNSSSSMAVAQLRLTIGSSRYGGSSFTPPTTLFPTA